MKKFGFLLLILTITLLQCRYYFRADFPYTHDGENHLARFANYKIALKEGQIPPRFAPNFMNHYGYPVFNFNYPLANILSIPFSILKVHPELTFKVLSAGFFAFGLLGMYQISRQFKLNTQQTTLSLLLFGLQPYFTNIFLYRGNIGELMALCCLPWLFFSLQGVQKQFSKKILFVIVWACFFLSHNLAVLLFTPILIVYAVMLHRKSRSTLFEKLFMIGITVLSSLWFWLPAIFENSYTVITETNLAKDFLLHFPTLSQLVWGTLQFGFSNTGPIDSLSFQLGAAQIMFLAMSAALLTSQLILKKKVRRLTLFYFFLALASILLQLSITSELWKIGSFLHILQFPWRLSMVFTVSVALLYCSLAQFLNRQHMNILFMLCVIQALTYLKLKPADFFHKNQIDYDLYAQSTSTQNENRTKDFTYLEIGDWKPAPTGPKGSDVQVESWSGTTHRYFITVRESGVVIEPTMFFPGWETQAVDSQGKTTKLQYLPTKQTQGRLAFELPTGTFTIRTHFTQNTPARQIGNTLSLLSLIGYTGYLFYDFHRQKHSD